MTLNESVWAGPFCGRGIKGEGLEGKGWPTNRPTRGSNTPTNRPNSNTQHTTDQMAKPTNRPKDQIEEATHSESNKQLKSKKREGQIREWLIY